jgi:sec-independent protein translocase protein TatA
MTSQLVFLSMPGGWEWILIILAVVLLFGGKKIPELMKGLGQGMREFKKARNETDDTSKKDDDVKRDTIKE